MTPSARLCTVCARGGSKGVKGKNLRVVAGRPLLAHSIAQAKESLLFDVIAVSSDSEDILSAAERAGATVLILRPAELASDFAGKVPAIQHCVREVEKRLGREFGTIVDLDVTAPLRTADDIREAVRILESEGVPNVITGCRARRSPYFNMVEESPEGKIQLVKSAQGRFLRRQDAPSVYDMNASIYVWRHDVLMESTELFHPNTRLFQMPEERSIDIDSELDLEIVEWLVNKREGELRNEP